MNTDRGRLPPSHDDSQWRQLSTEGMKALRSGQYAEAERSLRLAVDVAECHGGFRLADSLNALGNVYVSQARFADARSLFCRARLTYEKAGGKEHPGVAVCLHNLADIAAKLGDDVEAESIFKWSLSLFEKVHGSDKYPEVASVLGSLAGLYRQRGRLDEAEPLLRRSLAITEKALGPSHVDVGRRLHALAALYADQKRQAEADALFQRSLALKEKTLGPTHPNVATVLGDLATLRTEQGLFDQAETLLRRCLTILREHLGETHPEVIRHLINLGCNLALAKDYAGAEPVFQQALKALGSNPQIDVNLRTLLFNNYATLFRRTGRISDARKLEALAKQIRERHTRKEQADRASHN